MSEFSSDPAVERRLQQLEQGLATKAQANPEEEGSLSGRTTPGVPPRPGSVTASQNIGTVTVSWQPVGIANLRKYEVQASTTVAFTSPVTKATRSSEITFTDLTKDTTYYVRIRTVTLEGQVSAWTNPVNSQTGKADYPDLVQGAATNRNRVVQTSGFSPSSLSTAGTATGVYASLTLDFPTVASVAISAATKADFSLAAGHTLFIRPRIDGADVQEYENRQDSFASVGRATVPGLGLPDLAIAAGPHTFDVEVELDDNGAGGTSTLTPVEFVLVVEEGRR